MPRRANVEFKPDRRAERQLTADQRAITKALRLARERQDVRDQRASILFHERGYTQRALADLISEGSEAEGGPRLTEDAVQKALQRMAMA